MNTHWICFMKTLKEDLDEILYGPPKPKGVKNAKQQIETVKDKLG